MHDTYHSKQTDGGEVLCIYPPIPVTFYSTETMTVNEAVFDYKLQAIYSSRESVWCCVCFNG